MAWDDMTLEDIRLEVREILRESESETDPFWSNKYINIWINRMARTVAEATECIEGYKTFNTVVGQAVYDMPENIFKPELVKYGSNKKLKPITVRDLRNMDITVEGTPSSYLVFNKKLYLYDVPNTVETVHVWGKEYPPFLEADDSKLTGMTGDLIDVVIKLVLAKCYEKDQEYGVANNYYAQVPFDISDYIFKTIHKQSQEPPHTIDAMGYIEEDYW